MDSFCSCCLFVSFCSDLEDFFELFFRGGYCCCGKFFGLMFWSGFNMKFIFVECSYY